MDWSNELANSAIWLGSAFALSLAGVALATSLLVRFTKWGHQFWRISHDYFRGAGCVKPLFALAIIIFLTLFSVRLNILFSFWYNGFYSAMQSLDAPAFWRFLMIFSILASVHVARALISFFIQQAFLIRWREWLTVRMTDGWLSHQAYYRMRFTPNSADNPDQRIQQDIEGFTQRSLSLSMGLLDAVVSLISFSIILWNLSGSIELFGQTIPRAMIFMVYLYVIIATIFALKIGRPLIQLNFLSERLNANFRYALIRLREYGESIAFYGGEKIERRHLMSRFGEVIHNMWAIVSRSLKFQGFNLTVSQAAVVFPFIVQAPRLLSKQITLGDVMQTAQSFGQVENALSFLRSSYDDFTAYRAVLSRLTGFMESVDQTEKLTGPALQHTSKTALTVSHLYVKKPDQQVLVSNLTLSLSPASALLIRGHSGIGKTTLLRAIAGLWPYADGAIQRPAEPLCLFLPQKPYLPLGSLRTCLHYPASPASNHDERSATILQDCQLGHLVKHLDEEADWTQRLSLGEQQRLAIGRVLANRPSVIFLDEASSAMDEGLEYAMYQLLRQSLPDAILVSVGHRSTLRDFHQQELELLDEGQWRMNPI